MTKNTKPTARARKVARSGSSRTAPKAVRRVIIAKPTKLERRAERKGIVLRDIVVTARTFKRYDEAVSEFFNHCITYNISTPRTVWSLDDQLSARIEAAYQDGESKSVCADALCGLQCHIP